MSERICPWWMGYVLASPVRKLGQSPLKILSPYIGDGDIALDAGCAMGFFSIPMARLVGETGHAICVDIQDKMVRRLKKRAARSGFEKRMDLRVCTEKSLCIDDLAGRVDFALAFAVVHEVPDGERFLREIYSSMRKSGLLLIAEPAGHVSRDAFAKTTTISEQIGFVLAGAPEIARAWSVLLSKP